MAKRRQTYRRFTAEQKAQAVHDYFVSGESMYAVAKRLGINYVTLRRWVIESRLSTTPKVVPILATSEQVPQPIAVATDELETLRQANEKLAQELSLCKQAVAHFAQKCFLLASQQAA